MTDHEHVWHFFEDSVDGAFCVKGCHGRLSREEAETILNEHAKLKRVREAAEKIAEQYDYVEAVELYDALADTEE